MTAWRASLTAWATLVVGCGVRFDVIPDDGAATSVGGGGASSVPAGGGGGGQGGSMSSAEICSNGEDDDDNGAIDCADQACTGSPFCVAEGLVDDDAPPGGDGSLAHPFSTIAEATSICDGSTKTIFVFDGTYGPFVLPPNCHVAGESRDGAVVDGGGARAVTVPNGGEPGASIASLTITGGDAGDERGGGLLIESGKVALTKLRIRDCAASHGAGVNVEGGEVAIVQSEIDHNTATDGAGVAIRDGSLVLDGVTFMENVAGNKGGAIHVRENGALEAHALVVGPGNRADIGAGLHQQGTVSTALVERSTIRKNRAQRRGGGVFHNEGSLRIENSYVVDNTANDEAAGGIHHETGTLDMKHVTIANNIAGQSPAGIQCVGGGGTHYNMLIWLNQNDGSTGCPLFSSAIQESPLAANLNFAEDPLFVDAPNGDYHLSAGSNVKNRGDANQSLATDHDGDPRDDGAPDCGADELP